MNFLDNINLLRDLYISSKKLSKNRLKFLDKLCIAPGIQEIHVH